MKPRRRQVARAPVPPPDFDVDAEVQALYAETVGADDAAEWRRKADLTAEWCSVNSVEMNPEWGGRITARWLWDDTTGSIVRNLGQLSGPYGALL